MFSYIRYFIKINFPFKKAFLNVAARKFWITYVAGIMFILDRTAIYQQMKSSWKYKMKAISPGKDSMEP